jgi:hypothetical protein
VNCPVSTRGAPEKATIQRQIDTTDEQIDQLVYELYGCLGSDLVSCIELVLGKCRSGIS